MKLRITACSDRDLWYQGCVGKEYEIIGFRQAAGRVGELLEWVMLPLVRTKSGTSNIVKLCDCTFICPAVIKT